MAWVLDSKPERATPRLDLCHSVFYGPVCCYVHLKELFLAKMEVLLRLSAHSNDNIPKNSLIPFLGLYSLILTGLSDLKDILNSRQNISKNKLIGENAMTRVDESCSLQVTGSWWYVKKFKVTTLIAPLNTMKRPSSRVKLDLFNATFTPMSSVSLSLSGLVSTHMVRCLKSLAFRMTRLIALSPVGSPTSETMTIMLLVFFSM